MFCPNCGRQLPDGAKFCMDCGQFVDVTSPDFVATVPDPDTSAIPVPIPVADEVPAQYGSDVSATDMAGDILGASQRSVPAAADTPARDEATASIPYGSPHPSQQQATSQQTTPRPFDPPMPELYGPPPVPQQPAAATPAKKPWYKSTLGGVALATLALFLIVRLVTGIFLGSDADEPEVDVPRIVEEANTPKRTDLVPVGGDSAKDEGTTEEGLPVEDGGTEAQGGGSQGGEAALVGDASSLLDSHGYPTANAFMELTGPQLVELARGEGFYFYEGESANVWVNDGASMVFNIISSDGSLDEEGDFEELAAGCAGEPAIFVAVLEGYSSCAETFDGLVPCTVEDKAQNGVGTIMAVCRDNAARRYIVTVEDVEDGDYKVMVYNEEAVSVGYVDAILESSYGDTVTGVFETWAGRPIAS